MEFLMELLLEIIIEGSFGISTDKKIPKWIRYLFIIFLIAFFLFIIGGLLLLGFFIAKENIYAGLFIIFVSVILLIGCILKFRQVYGKRR